MSELADFLTARGYERVPLTRSGVGHFHTVGTLNGRPVVVLVDTGASCTVVAMSMVQTLGLQSEFLDTGRTGQADLRLGSCIPRLAGPVGLDFENVNAALRAQGSAEVDMILGADVFDYPSQSLILDGGRG